MELFRNIIRFGTVTRPYSNDSSSSLYIGMGFFGYLKYGSDIASTITLNMDLVSILPSFLNQDIKPLPGISRCPFFSFQEMMSQGAPLAEAALAMFSIAIFFSYALQVGSMIT